MGYQIYHFVIAAVAHAVVVTYLANGVPSA